MTHKVTGRPLPATPAPAATSAAAPSAMDQVDGLLEALWRFLSSMRFAMVLMLAIAVYGVAGTLLIQMPGNVAGNPTLEAQWVDSIRPRFGAFTDPLNALGLFNVFNSIVFRVLAAALTISLIACSIQRIPGMLQTARRPRLDVGAAFFEHAPQHEAIVSRRSAAESRALVEEVLHRRRYRTLAQDDGTVHLYADRFRWAPFAGLIAHLSIVLIIAGAIVGGMYGFRDPEFMVAEGQTREVAAQPGLAITVVDFTDRWDPTTGVPIDYVSSIIVLQDGVEVDRHEVRVNEPYRRDGLTFYQAFYGKTAAVTVTDAEGTVLVDAVPVPLAYQEDAGRQFGVLPIPGSPYTAEITATAGSSDPLVRPGQVQFGIYTSGATSFADAQVIDQGTPTAVGDLTVTFEREGEFTGLNVARDPGVPFVWIGSALLFVGFMIRFLVPHKRIWARVTARPNGGAVVGLATLTHKDVTAGTDFEQLVTDVRAALAAPAPTA
jgi:cytochrome c biogenesis protein